MQNNNIKMEEVTELELSTIDGGVDGWGAVAIGLGTALACLGSGGAFDAVPAVWVGCGLAGALVGIGSYML